MLGILVYGRPQAPEPRYLFPQVFEDLMPFSSLTDPVDLARAGAALEAAWAEVKAQRPDIDERECNRLAVIVASLVPLALDEDELARRAAQKFRS